jgi:hypothetical protein
MNNQKQQSIGERMAARQTDAEQKCRALLWADGEPEAVAAVALAGGLDPAKVDKLADEIGAAKAKLQAATGANDRLPELSKAHTAARSAATEAAKVLEAASAADDVARLALGESENALRLATAARDAGARLLLDGIIPAALAPACLVEIVAGWRTEQEATERDGQIRTLKQQIPWRESRVEGLEKELAEQKADDPKRENKTIGAAGFVDVQTAIESRLRTEREALKEAKAELRKLDKQVAS